MSADFCLITGAKGLDPIQVFWVDERPGVGSVTITCYGSAWTAWFGAMSDQTIREFFAKADAGYLFTNLGITRYLTKAKHHEVYLSKIIEAVKESLKPKAGPQ